MKKLIALLLALVMILSFAACSNDEPAENESEPENSQSEQPETPDEPSEPEEPAEPEQPKQDRIRGNVDSLVYTNDVAGITFTAPEGRVYYTDEQIAETWGYSSSEILTKESAEALENTDIVYDMYCQNVNTGASVNINFENLNVLYSMILDEKAYLEISKTSLSEAFSAESGMELKTCELKTMTLGDKEVPYLDITIGMTMEGFSFDLYEKVFVKKAGGFMGCVTLGALDAAEMDQLAAALTL